MTTEYSTELAPLLTDTSTAAQPVRGINLIRMLRMRAWLMLSVFLALAVPGAIAAWMMTPVKYNAEAVLRFASSRQGVMDAEKNILGSGYEKYVNTQVGLLKSPAILSRVLLDPEIRALPEVAKATDKPGLLAKALSARNQPGTELVILSCELTDAQSAFLIVKKVVMEYLLYDSQQTEDTGGWRRRTLTDHVKMRDTELQNLSVAIAALRKKLEMPASSLGAEYGLSETMSFNENLGRAQSDLTTAQTDVTRIENTLTELQALEERAKTSLDKEIFEFGIEDRVILDVRVASLRGMISSQEAANATKQNTFVEGAPQLKVAESQMASLREKLKQTQREVRLETVKSTLAKYNLELVMAQKDVEGARSRIQEFQGRIDEHRGKLAEKGATLSQIQDLDEKREDVKKLRDRMQAMIDQIDMDRNAPASVSVASQPSLPSRPDYGTRLQFIFLTVMGAMGAAAGTGVLRELTDQQLRSGQDLGYVTNLPILATVPHASADLLPPDAHAALLTADHPGSTTADEYRRILTRIIYPPEGSAELNTCLVVSPSRGDGKTSLACNLAISLALANRRVLVVDISARHPSIEHCFGLEPSEGLGEVLCNKFNTVDLIRPTEYPNLYVLGPGFRGNEIIGKLASRDIVEFLERAEEEFEHVIIDTPPALLMSDAKLLAPIVDGVIAVAGVGVSTSGMLRRCLFELQQGGANMIGVVLNGIRPTRGGYMTRKVGQYYAYSQGRGDGTADKDLPEMAVFDADESAESVTPAIMLVEDRKESRETSKDARS